jgi:hypothetical protein
MKKGQEVKQMLNTINDDVQFKEDVIVDIKNTVVKETMSVFPELQYSSKDSDVGFLNDNSLTQLCYKLDIGRTYINKCLPISQNLVVHNLSFWLKEIKSRNVMIRTQKWRDEDNKTVRAILSDRYKRIDNDIVANASLARIMDMGAELKYCNYDGDSLNITAVLPKIEGEIAKGDIVQAGITVTNNEVGNGSLKVLPFIYRLVCTNGMVAPEYIGQFYAKHVGKKLIDIDNDYQGDTSVEKMFDEIKIMNNPQIFDTLFAEMKKAKEKQTSSFEIVRLAKQHNLSDSERASIFERLGKVYGDNFSVDNYSLANAITNLANDENKSDQRARFLQELGGQIIFYQKPTYLRQ